jgi:DNA-binding transcriptional regulator YiaG
MSNDRQIEELRKALTERGLSPERAAPFFEVSFRTLYRWLSYESAPTGLYRKAIRSGLRRLSKIK